ncbi:MAG: hypothetical protein VYE73_08170 [Acidobacteriota bacterium]|nr:hypothetical protein [Acidobacteriota bacterium]
MTRFMQIRVASVALFVVACGASEQARELTAPLSAPEARPPQVAVTGQFPCDSIGEIHFICDMVSPEDIAVVPGAEWAIASGARPGGRLHLLDVGSKTATVLFPTLDRDERLDAGAYPDCPGPLDLSDPDASRLHGLYMKPGESDLHTLYAVHHGPRESVEAFEVNTMELPPRLAWVGCFPAPEGRTFNSVVALPDGGIAATSGSVMQWHANTGWVEVPGSEDAAANGLEVSGDGQFLFIAGWTEEKLTRVSRGLTPVQKDVVQLGFRPDNFRMSLDGTVIFAAGHTDKFGDPISDPREPTLETTNVATIDPNTLEVRRIFVHPAIDGLVTSTTATRIGDELWLGSYRGDRLAYLPMPE